jgi:hypothetical protein
MTMINVNTKTGTNHSGAVTHHQDQSIVSVSFKIKKIKNNSVKELLVILDSFFILFRISFFTNDINI